ncbi:MAG TPA: hypothetical protein VD903_10195 [Pseudonocardia sp.]|nr:hypothetical protein [Pseudonocardia sp.]
MQRIRGIDWNAIAMGLPLGVAVGIAMDEWVLGIPIGIMFGIAFAGGRSRCATREEAEPSDGPDGR